MKNKHTENNLPNNKLLELPSHLYRFRKLCHMSDKKELENQEIYFSTPEGLNDPLENSTNLFWKGDEIAWKGFFKHYIIVLEQWERFKMVVGSSSNIVLNTDRLRHNIHQLPTEIYKNDILGIYSKFFNHSVIDELIRFLGNMNRKIRRSELQFYLTTTLGFILNLIHTSFGVKNNYNDKSLTDTLRPFLNIIKNKSEEIENSIESIFDLSSSFLDTTQISLCIALENYDTTQKNKGKISSLMLIDNYLSILESITFPYWCAASFTQSCNNASLWGHYGDAHKGICLKFKTQKIGNEDIGIPMKNPEHFRHQSESVIPFTKILYQKKYPEYDFFKSIGKLTFAALIDYFSDEGNQGSNIDLIKDEKFFKEYYWKNFQEKISVKLNDWRYENEYRLIITSVFSDIQNENNRKFKYKFSSLEGIIFGIKTPPEEKFDIIKIISDKCRRESRTDFKFYQAYYDSNTGLIENKEMKILNLRIFSDIKK